MKLRYLIALSAFAMTACAREPAGTTDQPGDSLTPAAEASLAADFGAYADSTAARHGAPMHRLMEAFFHALRANPNPEAESLLAVSRALADSGRAARQAGDTAAARQYWIAAHELLFDAVVLVLPEAYERTGAVVDTIVARLLERLGDRDAPRIRAALERVQQLRAEAAAAAPTDEGHALALNMRALTILQHLREHLDRPGGRGLPGDQGREPPPGGPGRRP
jgi:hypothetical protein